jgi:hypothetical protein
MDEMSDEQRGALFDALDAYLNEPSEETEAVIHRAAPEGEGPWLVGFIDTLAEWPGSAWFDVLREADERQWQAAGPLSEEASIRPPRFRPPPLDPAASRSDA